jgi:hypothetical protein
MSFSFFFTQTPLFLFPAHKSHHLLPPLSSPLPCPIAGRPAGQRSWARSGMWTLHALEIFHRPPKSRATPSRSLHAATFLCRGRCWRHGEPRRRQQGSCAPIFTPWSGLPCGSSPGHHSPPCAYKSPTKGPWARRPQHQLRRAVICAWTHHSVPTLPKPTLPPPSPPQPEAAQPVPAPSSSPDRRHHHPHPPPALCHSRQATSVHPFPT